MAERFVKEKLNKNKITVFVKQTCPYCRNVLDILNRYNFKKGAYEIIDIDIFNPEYELREYFEKTTGEKTLPRIFFGKKCIGGYNDLLDLDSMNELDNIFKSMKIIRTEYY
ncbi:thioredoxin domain [Yokapox virus]|uniref:Glutaredoxin-1 n=1 Tax=Yokapox virus TaxID=1076255 RepID=G3EIC5_9POXV|nr:thioredoxin domain [Yokapox virus]AEN03636.1 nonessential glutaredoxin [Yokapox virus]